MQLQIPVKVTTPAVTNTCENNHPCSWVFVCHPTWVFTAGQRRNFHLILSGAFRLLLIAIEAATPSVMVFLLLPFSFCISLQLLNYLLGNILANSMSQFTKLNSGTLGSLSVVLMFGAYFYRDFSLHRRNCMNMQDVRNP